MRILLPVLVGFFTACTTQASLATSTEERLVAAAREEVERQIAADGHVDRFLVFLDAAGTTELGGIDGGGDGPGGGDVLRAMMERGHFTAAADITYPRSGKPLRVETMLVGGGHRVLGVLVAGVQVCCPGWCSSRCGMRGWGKAARLAVGRRWKMEV